MVETKGDSRLVEGNNIKLKESRRLRERERREMQGCGQRCSD